MVLPLRADDPVDVSGYRLQGRLGAGGMGTVYLSHTRGGLPLALKIIRPEFAADPEFRRRFAREVAAARRVQGAYTAAVLDSNTEGDQPWLASAYVAGPPLSEAVASHGPLPERSVLLLTAGIAEALESVHAAGVVHRDLKPSNVLLAADGPRVIDFGIARAGDATALTGTDVRLGTPAYMSPEQVEGRQVGPALDVFALGLVVHYAATGRHPFGEGDGQALMFRITARDPDLTACPERLRPIVARCLARDPAERPGLDGIIEACRQLAAADGADLTRGADWWLPQPLAAEATALAVGAAPRTQVETPVPPGPPPSPAPAPTPTPVSWSRAKILGAALVACAVGAAAALIAVNPFSGNGNGSGGGNGGTSGGVGGGSGDGYVVKQHDVPLTIPAPGFVKSSMVKDGRCVDFSQIYQGEKAAVYVDLDAMKADSGRSDEADPDVGKQYTIRYSDCSNGSRLDDTDVQSGTAPTSGLKLLDNRGSWGLTTKRTASPAECEKAARSGYQLPNLVSVQQIQKGRTIRPDTGICILTRTGTLVLLWINAVHQHPDNDKLSDFVTTATQWTKKT